MKTKSQKKPRDQSKLSGRSLAFRSRVTNGSVLADYVDGRSIWARRFRDLLHAFEADLGGIDNLSEGQRALARRAALLTVECEFTESKFATLHSQGTTPAGHRLDRYGRTANTLRRLIESLGLNEGRKQRDITPPDHTDKILEHLRAIDV